MIGRTRERTIAYYRQFWQHSRKRANCCRFCCPFLSTNEHAADSWLNSVEDQGQFHFFLAYNCAEWVCIHDSLSITCHTRLSGCDTKDAIVCLATIKRIQSPHEYSCQPACQHT